MNEVSNAQELERLPAVAEKKHRAPCLSLSELVIYLDGDVDLAHRVLRMLRLPVHDPDRPPRVALRSLERAVRKLVAPHN